MLSAIRKNSVGVQMQTYYLDTNILLRFLLKDNAVQVAKLRSYFLKAQQGAIKIVILPQLVIEMEYVLRKVYKYPKTALVEHLQNIVELSYIEIVDRQILYASVNLYKAYTIDFVDAYLFASAKANSAEVLSFDKDFTKIGQRARL